MPTDDLLSQQHVGHEPRAGPGASAAEQVPVGDVVMPQDQEFLAEVEVQPGERAGVHSHRDLMHLGEVLAEDLADVGIAPVVMGLEFDGRLLARRDSCMDHTSKMQESGSWPLGRARQSAAQTHITPGGVMCRV